MANFQSKILIVEHDVLMRGFLTELLSAHYHIDTAVGAWEAIGKLLRGHREVVLVDQDLPDLPGHALIDQIHCLNLTPITILMAGGEIESNAPEVASCDLLIRKPFDLDQMVKTVEWALQMHKLKTRAIP